MALILNIETATDVCSVNVASDGKAISVHEIQEGQSHAANLTVLIQKCLGDAGIEAVNLDAIAVSKGPGSFTGLRIGVATAKGICYSLDKPLISVNTLQSMAQHFNVMLAEPESNFLLCPMIDARRMEVYTAIFNKNIEFLEETQAKIIDNQSFVEVLHQEKIYFFGDGMPKSRNLLEKWENSAFSADFKPSSTGMIPFSEKSYIEKRFENLVNFEPFYLKDFYSPRQPM